MKTRLSFRIVPREGRYRAFEQERTDIKLNGKVVGYLSGPDHYRAYNDWRIRFMIKDPAEKSGFKWITLAHRSISEADGRAFIKRVWEKILEKYDLFWHDD